MSSSVPPSARARRTSTAKKPRSSLVNQDPDASFSLSASGSAPPSDDDDEFDVTKSAKKKKGKKAAAIAKAGDKEKEKKVKPAVEALDKAETDWAAAMNKRIAEAKVKALAAAVELDATPAGTPAKKASAAAATPSTALKKEKKAMERSTSSLHRWRSVLKSRSRRLR
jgi:hypothetical protein